jgi:hypothetical protein
LGETRVGDIYLLSAVTATHDAEEQTFSIGELGLLSVISTSSGVKETYVTVDVNLLTLGIEDIVLAVLLGHTLSPLLESVYGAVRPPISQSPYDLSVGITCRRTRLTLIIILCTSVVESMG